jgi:prevent-host-death family protein
MLDNEFRRYCILTEHLAAPRGSTCSTFTETTVKTVSARQANQAFSELLSQVERGEEVVILKHGQPVAVLSPYRPPLITPERRRAIGHAIEVMSKGLPWGRRRKRFTRDEMHEG